MLKGSPGSFMGMKVFRCNETLGIGLNKMCFLPRWVVRYAMIIMKVNDDEIHQNMLNASFVVCIIKMFF